MMTKWNEQAAPDNNLKANDINQDEAKKTKMGSETIDGDQLNDVKIQQEIIKQNI
ncbi:hypothetical protein SRABI96_00617 [Peribacillus sp. Bi96]|uniref:hypothetical protein n=1 Tax=unclassified Peribacillus TaxID=2675266 RepID=UPI001DFB9C0F|nr:hypothetical protein [Peribacillus sp. Bi96]CAH0147215.1 hypothetical protein SRABI96_00617 [Peribacillus sp. Bi96]